MPKLKIALSIFFMFLAALGKISATSDGRNMPPTGIPNGEIAFVSRVIDGDTIEVRLSDPAVGSAAEIERVRYIGMDTPETVDPDKPAECFGSEASARNRALVAGKYVLLKKDVRDRDAYGRLLRFVYVLKNNSGSDPIFVNLTLIEEGYARALTVPPDIAHAAEFESAAAAAQAAHLGFWSACGQYPFQ